MARRKWKKLELKIFIMRHYPEYKYFCEHIDVNIGTLHRWLREDVYFPKFEQKIYDDMVEKNYNIDLVIEKQPEETA